MIHKLVFILLIVAVVIGGTVLKKATQIKLLVAEVQEIKAKTKQFEILFNYLPGDFPDAASLWGNDCNGSSTGSAAAFSLSPSAFAVA